MNPKVRPSSEPLRMLGLGTGAVLRPDGSRVTLRTRKHLALLLILALRRGRSVTRDRLIELLWSEDGEKKARHSLSQSVSLINKAAGADVIVAAGPNQLAVDVDLLSLDVDEFEDHAANGRRVDARALWHGTLLDGLWLRRAPAFERWIADERSRLERLMRRLASELIELCRHQGDHVGMRAEAEALLALDPLDETAMLACLQALTLCGERTLALRRYTEFEARLRAELDAEPGPQLRSWARRHRKGESPAPAVPSISRVHELQSLPAVQPMFGRVEEYRQLWESWERAQTGAGSFWIIEGEPGIGKTALVGKLANQVHVSGASVCFVKCYRTEKSVPFAPISALIRQLARLPGFMAMNASWIGELSRLVPELRDRFPNAPAPMGVDDSARFRLCDATVHAAECVADEQPLLIVADDIHDADEPTLALLHYLGRQVLSKALILIATARSGYERSEFEKTFFTSSLRSGLASGRVLGSLEDESIGKLVAQLLASKGLNREPAVVDEIIASARGNPLFAIESALSPRSAGRSDTFSVASIDRLQDLTSLARSIASALALAGRPMGLLELGEVSGQESDALIRGLAELQMSSFVRRAGDLFCFTHDQYQVAAESCTPDYVRARMHSRLAQHLGRQAAAVPQAPIEVARHLAASGSTGRALKHALSAAHYARSLGAVRELATALELASTLSGRSPNRLAELAECYLNLKEFDEVRAICTEIESQVTPGTMFAVESRYLKVAADHQSGAISIGQARKALAEVVACGRAFPHELGALLQLLRLAGQSGDKAEARRVTRLLRSRAKPAESSRSDGYRALAVGYEVSKFYWPRRALTPLEDALAEAQRANDWELELVCREGLGAVLKQVGRFGDSLVHIRHGLEFARKTLNPQAEAACLSNLAVTEIALGGTADAQHHLELAAAIDINFPRWPIRSFRLLNEGVLSFAIGHYDKAVARLRTCLDMATTSGLWTVELASKGMLAMCAVRMGDTGSLAHLGEQLLGSTPAQLACVPDRGPSEAALAWYCLLKGQPGEALSSLDRASAQLRRRDVDHWMFVELERIRLKERLTQARLEDERARLHCLASEVGARLFAQAAQEVTPPVPPC